MRVAIVYDWVNKWGGAERVLLALNEIWPKAVLFTSVYAPADAHWASVFKVKTSFLNSLPFAANRHELVNILMPIAFESIDLTNFDIVVSVSSASAKGVMTSNCQLHICYCLTPTRFIWSGYRTYFHSRLIQRLLSIFVKYWRRWDRVASARPDKIISISGTVRQRVKEYYQRDSTVIYPPVETDKFYPKKGVSRKDYYLVVSRLVPYKKVDLVIKAFNKNRLPLKIVGQGSQRRYLQRIARKNIEFLGLLTDAQLLTYYQNCHALIMAQEEDFGIVSLEAQACGKPVIAFNQGGGSETVIDGQTGVLFSKQDEFSLNEAVQKLDLLTINPVKCRQNAKRFDKELFKAHFKKFVEQQWEKKN